MPIPILSRFSIHVLPTIFFSFSFPFSLILPFISFPYALSFPSVVLSSWSFQKSLCNLCLCYLTFILLELLFSQQKLYFSCFLQYLPRRQTPQFISPPALPPEQAHILCTFFYFLLVVSILDFSPVFSSWYLFLDTPSHCFFGNWILLCIRLVFFPSLLASFFLVLDDSHKLSCQALLFVPRAFISGFLLR